MNNCRFGNVQPAFFLGVFLILPVLWQKEGNFLRSCSFVKFFFGQSIVLALFPFVVNCQKVQCSTQIEGDSSHICEIRCAWLVFCFRGTLNSIFCQFFNCFLTGIASLNITAQCRPQARDPNMISPTFPKLILRNGNYSQRICRIML